MAFIYYISDIQGKPTKEKLDELELFDDVKDFSRVERFEDGSSGCIFTLKGRSSKEDSFCYDKNKQKWTKIPDTKLWIGVYIDKPFNPDDLLKHDYLGGYDIELGDGKKWTIPKAISFVAGCVLPETIISLKRGEYKRVVIDKYLELHSIAMPLTNLFAFKYQGKTENEVDVSSFRTEELQFELCEKILAVNYNISYREISILKLLNSENLMKILEAVVDVPHVEEIIRKERESIFNQGNEKKNYIDMKCG